MASACLRDEHDVEGIIWAAPDFPGSGGHTFASHFMMFGGNILTLQKLLGHSSVAVTMKYAHLAPDFMRDEIGRLCFERPAAEVADITAGRARAGER